MDQQESSNSSSSPVREEGGYLPFDHGHHHRHSFYAYDDLRRNALPDYRFGGVSNLPPQDNRSSANRKDSCSCVIVVVTFWFFVSMTLILGIYGPSTLRLGPNSSILIQPSPIFVESIKVRELDGVKHGLKLYGFYKAPPLDARVNWSEVHHLLVPPDSHKEWISYLNKGTQINISYNVTSKDSSAIIIIADGKEGLALWLEDPAYPGTTLSWNKVQGSGGIRQYIHKSSSYYVGVGNLYLNSLKVSLNIEIEALLYNTTGAYYSCTIAQEQCSFNVELPEGNAGVLTTPGTEQGASKNEYYVRLTYGPRWITYVIGIVGMTVLVSAFSNAFNKFHPNNDHDQEGETGQEEEGSPFLSTKDDLSNRGSSYDSHMTVEDLEDVRSNGSSAARCAICFDAPRDCFFLPCGHCVSCYECGTRIAEASGTCPICRRKMKKVRRIYTV